VITLDAIAPDGTRERLRFATKPEAGAAADRYREVGHSITWVVWVREPATLRHHREE
jgi:hypothetical protein